MAWKEIDREEYMRLRNGELYIADCGGALFRGGDFMEYTPYHYIPDDQWPDLRVERRPGETRYFKFVGKRGEE